MRQPEYVEKRRLGLETYIQTLLLQFDDNLPQEIQDFLESDKFVSWVQLGMQNFTLFALPLCMAPAHILHEAIYKLG